MGDAERASSPARKWCGEATLLASRMQLMGVISTHHMFSKRALSLYCVTRHFFHRNSLPRPLGVSGLLATLLAIARGLPHQGRRVRPGGLFGTSWPTDSEGSWGDSAACRLRAVPLPRLDHIAPAAPLEIDFCADHGQPDNLVKGFSYVVEPFLDVRFCDDRTAFRRQLRHAIACPIEMSDGFAVCSDTRFEKPFRLISATLQGVCQPSSNKPCGRAYQCAEKPDQSSTHKVAPRIMLAYSKS